MAKYNVQFPGRKVLTDQPEESVLAFFPEMRDGIRLFENFNLTTMIFIRHNGEMISITRRLD